MTIPFQTLGIDAIIAFFVPLVVAIVKQAGWSSQLNGLVAVVCYILFGIVGVLLSGQQLTLENFTALWVVFQTVGTSAYGAFWKNTGIEPAIQSLTSLVKTAPVTLPTA